MRDRCAVTAEQAPGGRQRQPATDVRQIHRDLPGKRHSRDAAPGVLKRLMIDAENTGDGELYRQPHLTAATGRSTIEATRFEGIDVWKLSRRASRRSTAHHEIMKHVGNFSLVGFGQPRSIGAVREVYAIALVARAKAPAIVNGGDKSFTLSLHRDRSCTPSLRVKKSYPRPLRTAAKCAA